MEEQIMWQVTASLRLRSANNKRVEPFNLCKLHVIPSVQSSYNFEGVDIQMCGDPFFLSFSNIYRWGVT